LSGGEPTLRDDLYDIVNYGQSRKTILTNGTTLFEEHNQKWLTSNKVNEIRVSLDSVSNCDWVCGKPNTYSKVKKSIALLKELEIPFVIYTVLGDFNIAELDKLYDLVISSNAYRWDMDFPLMKGRMKKKSTFIDISNQESAFKLISRTISKYLTQKPSFKLNFIKFFYSDMLNADLESIFKFDPSENPCAYALKTITVKTNGDVCLCPGLPVIFGNIKKSSIRDILHSPSYVNFVSRKITDFNVCNECKYLVICRGGCMADAVCTTGTMNNRDLSYCRHRLELYQKYILPIMPDTFRNNILKLIN